MPQKGWMVIKRDTPVQFSDDNFYTEAQIMESKLKRLDTSSDPEEAITECIGYRVDFDTIVQEVIRQIYTVKKDVEEYEELGEVMYRLIETNLKYYRKENIDRFIDPSNGRGAYNTHEAEMLRTNMLKLLKTIKDSLNNSIDKFKDKDIEELDERLIFLALLAKNIESSIRLYGEYDIGNGDDGVLGMVEDTADMEDEDKDMLDDYTEEISDVNQALEEVDEDLKDL